MVGSYLLIKALNKYLNRLDMSRGKFQIKNKKKAITKDLVLSFQRN